MKKIFYFILFVLGIIFFYYRIEHKTIKTYKIGMMSGWPPFMSINDAGRMTGFDVAVVDQLRAHMQAPIEIIDCGSLTGLFSALENKKIDMIMSGLDVTQKRKNSYDHVLYVSQPLKHVVCVSAIEADTFADFINCNPRIALEGGVSWEGILDQYQIKNKTYLSSVADMVMSLNAQKVDAFIIDETQYNRMADKTNSKKVFTILIPQYFAIDGMGIFFRKNDPDRLQIQTAIEQMQQDGTMQTLIKQWGICE